MKKKKKTNKVFAKDVDARTTLNVDAKTTYMTLTFERFEDVNAKKLKILTLNRR
jgi:hypothetical protein